MHIGLNLKPLRLVNTNYHLTKPLKSVLVNVLRLKIITIVFPTKIIAFIVVDEVNKLVKKSNLTSVH